MGTPGSDRRRLALPAGLAPIVVVLGIAAMQAFQLGVGLVLAQPTLARLLRPLLSLRPVLLGSELLLATPALMAVALLGIPLAEGVGLRRVDRRTLALALAAGPTLWAASLGVFEVQYLFWRPPDGYLEAFRRLHDALHPAGPLDAALSVVAIAVGPAVCEELVFRGVVLPAFVRPFGAVGAAFASAALFGLIHIDFQGGALPSAYRVPFAFVIGVALAAMRLRTGALWPSILAHATLNTITFVAAPWTDDPVGVPEAHPVLGVSLLLIGGLASLAVFRALPPSLTREGARA